MLARVEPMDEGARGAEDKAIAICWIYKKAQMMKNL